MTDMAIRSPHRQPRFLVGGREHLPKPEEVARQQIDEARDVLPIERPPRSQHPQDRAKLGAKRGQALGEEIADAFAGINPVPPAPPGPVVAVRARLAAPTRRAGWCGPLGATVGARSGSVAEIVTPAQDRRPVLLVVVGRQRVGKTTLLNTAVQFVRSHGVAAD